MPNTKPRKGRKPVGASQAAPKAEADPAPPPVATDTELALLALYAEDAFGMARARGDRLDHVVPDPRLLPKWTATGTITAVDALVRIGRHKFGARRVFYGWELRSQSESVLAIRGTEGGIEWLIDGLFAPRAAHPVAGRVESGFWSVYQSMQVNGRPLSSVPGPITIVGHSLGGALSTYAGLDLARAGAKVRCVLVASPHPGDADFCAAFGKAVPDHVMYRNVRDIVPRVPFWFGYSHVPNVVTLSAAQAGVRITGGPAGQHHVLSYVALKDRAALASFRPLACDRKFLDCISAPGS